MTASAQGWNAGFLDSDLNAQLGKWNPEKPTLVVVDYSGSKLATVRNLLAALRGADSAPVRVLLLDRYYSDSTTLGKEARDAARRQPWVPDGIRCGLLSVDDFVAIAGRAYWLSEGRELSPAQKRGVQEALDTDQWKKRALRPLYATIVGRILAERPGDGLEIIASEDLFDYVVEHEAKQWRMAGVTPADVNVCVLATLAGGLPADSVPAGDCTEAHDAGRAARVASHSYSDGYYPPLEPDLVGSAFVVARWRRVLTIGDETPEQARECCEGMVALALKHHGESAARTLGWIAEGYGKDDAVAEWLRGHGMPESVKAAVTAARGEEMADAEALRAQLLLMSSLADSLMARGEVRLAAEQFESAHRLAEQLRAAAGTDDRQARRDLSVSWEKVGNARAALGDRQGALDAYEESLALRQALADERPGDPGARRDLSVSWNKVGEARAALGDRQGALDAFNESLALDQSLADERPGDPGARRDLSVSWEKVGDARAALGDSQGALDAYSEALALDQALAAERPGDPQARRDLSVSWSRVGDARAALGDAQGALDAYNESLALTQALAAERPDDPEARRDLSASWNKVGVARAALGDWQGTLGAYNKSLALCQALAAERPGDPQARRDLSVAWVKVGKARAALGDAQRALEAYSESHALRQALADERPGDPEARRDLFVSNWMLASFHAAIGDRAAACRHLADCRKHAEWLVANAPGIQDVSRMLETVAAASKELGCQ